MGFPFTYIADKKSACNVGDHSSIKANWKTQQWPQDWKRSIFIPIPKKGNAKEFSNYPTTAHMSYS